MTVTWFHVHIGYIDISYMDLELFPIASISFDSPDSLSKDALLVQSVPNHTACSNRYKENKCKFLCTKESKMNFSLSTPVSVSIFKNKK